MMLINLDTVQIKINNNISFYNTNAFYNKKNADLIQTFNYDDHIEKISECDWIIEAISERLDWKKDLYSKILEHLSENCVVTSNTSGISLKELIEINIIDIKLPKLNKVDSSDLPKIKLPK